MREGSQGAMFQTQTSCQQSYFSPTVSSAAAAQIYIEAGKLERPHSAENPSISTEWGTNEGQVSEVSISLSTASLNEVRIAGNLTNFVHVWERLTSDPEVLSAVRGYRIPFSSPPTMRPFLNEPTFASSVEAHCDAEILRLLNKGAISQVLPSEDQFLSSFFLIEKSSGGMRFILNLKELNRLFPAAF